MKLVKIISNIITSHVKAGVFGDLFAGTGAVSRHFAKIGYSVFANDVEKYSYYVSSAVLNCPYSDKLSTLIDTLNQIEPIEGLFYKHYSVSAGRLFFTDDNAKKIDTIRENIEILKNKAEITELEFVFLIGSLLESADSVANTASVYGAFLKKIKKSALTPFVLKPIHTNKSIEPDKHTVLNRDIFDILPENTYDVVYLDPPYVARQYGANYCPLNYLCLYNKDIQVRNKTGLIDYYKSPFASKQHAIKSFKKLFAEIKTTHLFLSYNNNGIVSLEKMIDLLAEYGDVITYVIHYRGYKSNQATNNKTTEYLHYLCFNGGNKKEKIQWEL
jgi:adenine-specific DNA-methyltransferase